MDLGFALNLKRQTCAQHAGSRTFYVAYNETPTIKEITMTHSIDTLLGFVPFGLIVLFLLTILWIATKLIPSFGEFMNKADQPIETVEYYEKMYGTN